MAKICRACLTDKDSEEFARNRRRADGLQSECRKCRDEINREYKLRMREATLGNGARKRAWTEREDDVVRSDRPIKEIAVMLRRTHAAVTERRSALK